MARLGDAFILIRNGASIKQTDGAGGYPITRIETISNREVDRNKFGYAGIEDVQKYSDYILRDADILMSHINSEKHLGKVAIYQKRGNEQIIHGMNLLLLRANQEKLFPQYAYYYFATHNFQQQIQKITKKSVNQASFTVTALKEVEIPLPEMEKQRKIAVVLDKVSDLIAIRKQQLEKLEELVKARFVEMFGNTDYDNKQFIELIQEGAGLSYGIVVPGDNVDDGIPMVRPSDFKNGQLNFDNIYRVAPEIECKYKRTRLNGNEILVQVIGQPGQVMLSDERCKGMNVTRNLAVVRIDEDKANRLFISHYLTTDEAQMFMFGSTNQSTLKQLPLNKLKELPVPLVPLSEQMQFADLLNQVDKSKLSVQKSLDQLETLKKALLQKYFG